MSAISTPSAPAPPIARLHDMSEIRIEIDVPEILFQSAGDEKNIRIMRISQVTPKPTRLASASSTPRPPQQVKPIA